MKGPTAAVVVEAEPADAVVVMEVPDEVQGAPPVVVASEKAGEVATQEPQDWGTPPGG